MIEQFKGRSNGLSNRLPSLFYLDEIVDTIIILLKGRRSSLLQTYHHAGAIITMYLGYNYRAHPIWIFTTFNSFVHTIMYAYYGKTRTKPFFAERISSWYRSKYD